LAASLLLLLGRGPKHAEPLATEPALLEAVAWLAHERPDLFGDFRPLTSAERLSPPSPALRGGPRLVSPGSTVLEPRPAFRWDSTPGVTQWTVIVREADGTTLWSSAATGSPHAYPSGERDLTRGTTYIWELRARGPLGETSERRGFHVADEAGVLTCENARALIARTSPPGLRPLLMAQFAFRRGLYDEAERAIREFLGESPTDAVGRETAYAILRAQGASEAESYAPKGGGR
jgi:hypothetical protein